MIPSDSSPAPMHPGCLAAISQAERKVLIELSRGLTNKGIASALVLSLRTVESHISSMLSKTGCRSRTQLLLWALARERCGG